MKDRIVLIHSNGHGDPAPGPYLHWVRFTDKPNPAPVNQLSAGGEFPHSDCGEACVASILKDRGNPDTVDEIEDDTNAGAAGTNAQQLIKSLAEDGQGGPTHAAPDFPSDNSLTIMNPIGGRVLRGQVQAYHQHYAGTTIWVVDYTPPAPAPPPPPPAPAPAPVPIQPPPTPPAPHVATTHVVGVWPAWDGSLIGIAQHFYGDANRWHQIYAANAAVIEAAAHKHGHPNANGGNLIFPGTVLEIP